ncbi:MAG TPA: hypothetical protein VK543_05515 [Puia sp.]|nr:hypothetical protein [Puia sp.]
MYEDFVKDPSGIAEGKSTWVGALYELKNWTDRDLDSQRFWITVILINLMAIAIGVPELKKKK